MAKFKIGVKQDKKCLISSAAGVLFSLLGLAMYLVTSSNTKLPADILIISASAVGTLASLISIFLYYFDGILSICSAALLLFSTLMFLSSQAGNIGYAAAGIADIGYGIQGTLIIGIACYMIAVIGECIAVFDKKNVTKIRIEK